MCCCRLFTGGDCRIQDGISSQLSEECADVHVIMTKNATEFISPLVFETLTGNKCMTDTFDRDFKFDAAHIYHEGGGLLSLPGNCEFYHRHRTRMADDMLTTTFLAANCTKLVVPAMNTQMFLNPILLRAIS